MNFKIIEEIFSIDFSKLELSTNLTQTQFIENIRQMIIPNNDLLYEVSIPQTVNFRDHLYSEPNLIMCAINS